MESHDLIGAPGRFNHIYSYQTSECYCIAIQLRPPYETGRAGTEIHKITSDWDSRKGIDDLTPNDIRIRFTARSIEVSKRGGSSAWTHIEGLHGSTFASLDPEKCYWTMTRHDGKYWLVSIELVKKTPGKLWSRLMRDEKEANRPGMKWDKDMQKTPMITDQAGCSTPSTYCHPHSRPKYELAPNCGGGSLMLEDANLDEATDSSRPRCRADELLEPGFATEESTLDVAVSARLDAACWRRLQRGGWTSEEAFEVEVPFGGNHIEFFFKGDRDHPILKGRLGGSVWRKGCRWHVEQQQGHTVLELRLPKQTPEPWSFIVEGYPDLERWNDDPYVQRIADGLWDDEALEEKAKGDDHFRLQEYRAASTCYSRALERNPDSYITITNRAAAQLAYETEKTRVEAILEDALRALEINPRWHKAKFREGIALCKLHRYDEAIAALEAGHRLDASRHPGWDEEIQKVKQERIEWHNRKRLSYLNDIE